LGVMTFAIYLRSVQSVPIRRISNENAMQLAIAFVRVSMRWDPHLTGLRGILGFSSKIHSPFERRANYGISEMGTL